MLKWAVIKKTSEDEPKVPKSHLIEEVCYDDAIQITAKKFRRHSHKFNNHNAELKSTSTFYSKQNKENYFTSTPVKIYQNHRIVLRDLSNQTLKNLNRKIITKQSMQQNTCLRPSKEERSCRSRNKCTLKLNNFLNYKNLFRKSNKKPLELEKSRVQKFLEQNCTCKSNYNYSSLRSDGYDYYYSPTLPTLEIEDSHISVLPDLNLNILIPEYCSRANSCSMYNSDNEYDEPLKKKFRYDSTNSSKICGVSFNTEEKVAFVVDKVNRVKQLINFNKIVPDENRSYIICKEVNRSCSTNYLTFIIMVCTIIQKCNNINDSLEINKFCEKYAGLLVNLQASLQKLRNELNKTHEEKLKNTLCKKRFIATIDSFKSEFIKAKTNYFYEKDELLKSNIIDTSFLNKEINIKSEKEICRITATTVDFSNTSRTYDEKYVDRGRKRSYSALISNGFNTKVDEAIECDSDTKCSLKRQNCVRRIKR